jgi:stage III sporulation protein AB
MLLKIAGSLLVIAAAGLIGYILSRDCAVRAQELRDLQGMLQMLENEISFLSSPLTEAFEGIQKTSRSKAAVFFQLAEGKLRSGSGMNAYEAWETSVREGIKKTSLNAEDEEILVTFGKLLGSSDVEGQVKNIRLALSQLKMQEQKAEDNRYKNEAMYRRLGILGGLAVVIVLF